MEISKKKASLTGWLFYLAVAFLSVLPVTMFELLA
jgi:hypothetical protein